MRLFSPLIIATVAVLFVSLQPANAQLTQQDIVYADKPLMIVRYNKPRVYISQSLDRAVKAAEQAKPGILYRVVAYVPETLAARTSRAYLRSFVEGIRMNGVPVERIAWQTEQTAGSYPEIHLYVQ